MNKLLASLKNNELLATLFLNPTFIKYKAFILPTMSIFIAAALLFMIIIPQVGQYQETNKSMSEFDGKFTFYSDKIKDLEATDEESYRSNISTSLKVLPEDRNIPGAIGQVLQIINRSGLSLDGMTFAQNAPAPAGVTGLQIKIDVTGQKNRLLDFFDTVKSTIRITKITGLDVVSGTDATRIQANVTLTTYSQPLTMIAPNPEQPISPVSEKDLEVLAAAKKLSGETTPISTDSAGPVGKDDPFE